MINGVMFLEDKLAETYYLYEFHAWQHPECKVNVYIEPNIISIGITNNDEDIDSYTITFENCDEEIFEFLSLSLFNVALGCVMIHKDGDYKFVNEVHRPYLNFVITDYRVLMLADELARNQNKIHVNEAFEAAYPEIPFSGFKYDALEAFDKRTELTKKRLRESIR